MSARSETLDAYDSVRSTARRRLLHAGPLLVVGAVCAAGAAALLWPRHLLSREMTWDLLFNLAGAWHLYLGHVPHIDFHDPVGVLSFYLTSIGFHLVGVSPRAFLVGTTLMAIAIFGAATAATVRRLPPIPAALFVLFVTLLVLRPSNVGDAPDAYSFAMSYNRYGWAAVSVIALILFLPPRSGSSGYGAVAGVACLLLTLFYLKVTYFIVGLAGVSLAVLVCRHLQPRRTAWLVLIALAALHALAPHSQPYLADVTGAASGGAVRSGVFVQLNRFFAYPMDSAPYVGMSLAAIGLWWSGRAPLELPVAVLFLIGAGAALLSQNAQAHGLPIAIVIVFLLYGQFQPALHASLPGARALYGAALMALPLLGAAAMAFSLAGYWRSATAESALFAVGETRLSGLAVPTESGGLLAAYVSGTGDYRLLNRSRSVAPRYELSQYEYVSTLLEAASFLESLKPAAPRILVLDQVNPLPFMLGMAPIAGEALWWDSSTPVERGAEALASADVVLIPKFATLGAWRDSALALYQSSLDEKFPFRSETPSWFVASRTNTGPAPPVWPFLERLAAR